MFFKSLAHSLMWVLSALFLLAAVAIAGWAGFLGQGAEAFVSSTLTDLKEFYRENAGVIKLVGAIIGSLGTAATAIFGMFKAWYYAEQNLPKRLQHFIETVGERNLVGRRHELLSRLEQLRPTYALVGGSLPTGWRHLRKRVKIEKFDRLVRNLSMEVDANTNLLQSGTSLSEREKATLRYIEGRRAAFIADGLKQTQAAPQAIQIHQREALAAFADAARLDRSDPDCHEQAALQAEELLDRDVAISHWSNLAKLAEERGDWIRQATAMYREALLHEAASAVKGIPQVRRNNCLKIARDLLKDGRELISERHGEKIELYALTCESLGRVRISLRRLPTARQALELAEASYASASPRNVLGLQRVAELVTRLDAALAAQSADQDEDDRRPEWGLIEAHENLARAQLNAGQHLDADRSAKTAIEHASQIEPRDEAAIARLKVLAEEIRSESPPASQSPEPSVDESEDEGS